MSSPDKEFILRGGSSEQSAIHNRISAIERINFLSGIDIRAKSANYLKVLEVAMWKDWLKDEAPDKKIDEEFCQKAAEIVKKMEGNPVELNKQEYAQSVGEHQIKLQEKENVNRKSENNPEDVRTPDEKRQDRVCTNPANGSNNLPRKKRNRNKNHLH